MSDHTVGSMLLSDLRDNVTTSRRCRMLSTAMHSQCWGRCDCTCHERGSYGGANTTLRRPHSFPRPDWEEGKRPAGFKEQARRARREEERLFALAVGSPVASAGPEPVADLEEAGAGD